MRRMGAALWFAVFSALQNFRRNLGLSLTGVMTIGLILAAMGSGLVATHLVSSLLDEQQQHASNIQIYLQDSISEASVANYEAVLANNPEVSGVSFTNKDQSLAVAESRGIVDPSSISALGGQNPLPASINVSLRQLNDLAGVAELAKTTPIVDTGSRFATDYNSSVTSTLETVNRDVFLGAVVGILLFGFISLVIIMNTIRTAVFARRVEIEIMKLVGATDWFVRWPFVIEGMLGGLIAAAFSGALVFFGYRILVHVLENSIFAVSYNAGFAILMIAFLALAGALLGAFGSYLGVRRFLTV